MADNTPALRKRQQIENAGRTMFLWVAGAAAIVGISAVLSLSLVERITFRQEVIGEKNKTVDTLKKNNETVETLKQQVRVLNTNPALNATPRLAGTEAISVILDALPANPNSSALGASLQQKLLNVSAVSVDSLTVNPIAGVEDTGEESSSESGGENEITFQFAVTASNASSLKQVLRNLEKSIRVIDLTSVTIEQQSSRITLNAEGRAYYQPETKVELKEKSLRP
ncbi:MAG TPA: hypothetical protein PK096_02075 [Candidatus Saccharibacteria bacterium]|nr:hypothetical protein [Candidatus Saccharibacteria bacterium]HRK94135.1 hypothetical protein [Candidatus Saccharibacteria bacterium]